LCRGRPATRRGPEEFEDGLGRKVEPLDLAQRWAPYAVVGGWPERSADLLRQLDDDPLRAADVAEPIDVA